MENLITPSPSSLHCSESPGKNSKEKVHLCIYCLLKLKYNPSTWGFWIIFGHNNKISCSTCKFYTKQGMAVLRPGSVLATWPWPQPVWGLKCGMIFTDYCRSSQQVFAICPLKQSAKSNVLALQSTKFYSPHIYVSGTEKDALTVTCNRECWTLTHNALFRNSQAHWVKILTE